MLRKGAADLVIASFKKGLSRTDFTKIELQASPCSLVEDGACIDVDRIGLQYNNDGGNDWTPVDFKTTLMFGGEYKFTIEHITPCKDHYFKLIIVGKGEFFPRARVHPNPCIFVQRPNSCKKQGNFMKWFLNF